MRRAASCKDRPPSLARRMVFGLIALQALIGLTVILSEPLFAARHSLSQWLQAQEVEALLRPSFKRDPAGRLFLQPTPRLTDYMKAEPGFWFVGSDGDVILRGGASKEELVPKEEGKPSRLRQGATLNLRTGGGAVAVLFGGAQGDLFAGVRAWLNDRLKSWLLGLVIVAPIITGMTILLVRFLLRPVRLAAQVVSLLEPGSPTPALPEKGVPLEILPLVTATNAAFERLERSHEVQRRFIANAAHELRTPITILGIRLDELPESDTKQRLRQDVRRLTMLANQLLDLERLQHPGLAENQPIDLVALTREVVAEMAPLAIDNGSALSFQSALPRLEIRGDEQALRGVFFNLLSNALAHGGAGVGVDLHIRADGLIAVADYGRGITGEARDRIFEAFHRGDDNRSSGAGLGLYIVREVLGAHDATIELRDSQPGTVFQIRFAQAKAGVIAEAPQTTPSARLPQPSWRPDPAT